MVERRVNDHLDIEGTSRQAKEKGEAELTEGLIEQVAAQREHTLGIRSGPKAVVLSQQASSPKELTQQHDGRMCGSGHNRKPLVNPLNALIALPILVAMIQGLGLKWGHGGL